MATVTPIVVRNNRHENMIGGDYLPGPEVSADRGDANVTLQWGVDAPIQRFASTLTANRVVTLSTTGAVNGAYFEIIRVGLGAFTLDVGGLKLIAALTASTVIVRYDGTAWRLANVGLL